MTYIPVRISHVRQGEWEAYIPFYDEFVNATSKPKLEYATYAYIEEAQGLRDFHITWLED
jgi:hypothetical protein